MSLRAERLRRWDDRVNQSFLYETTYAITLEGQVIGAFTFSGGSGTLNSTNKNTLTLDLSDGFYPEDGLTLNLFNIAEGDLSAWENVKLVGVNECEEGKGYKVSGIADEENGLFLFQNEKNRWRGISICCRYRRCPSDFGTLCGQACRSEQAPCR